MKTTKSILITVATLPVLYSCNTTKETEETKPNILFIIADDISRTSMGAYGNTYIKTPAFDRIAEQGILFTNAFVTNPKSAPARAGILTGRYSWQLEESANHWPIMSDKWVFYPDLIEASGYFMGFTGKGWGPGIFPGEHNPAGWEYNDIKLTPPYKSISSKDYSANFEFFLNQNSDNKPFVFWLGTHEAHRAFEKDVHKKKNINPDNIPVQDFFPDNEITRGDIADYGVEVEYHDDVIGKALKILEEKNLLENTLIIATSDHGMAFPRIKGQIYDEGFHVAFAAMWRGKIKPGRIVEDFISFPDIAPTFMEAAGLKPHIQMTGKSFMDILVSEKSGIIDTSRSFALLGKERHDIGRTDGELLSVGYPVRAIRDAQYLYAKNYRAERWPAGDPEYNYKNCDDSPTKSLLLSYTPENPNYKYYELSFGKRHEDELYDIINDPDCINNLDNDPEYFEIKKSLIEKMESELKRQSDPRMFGHGDIFDYYPQGNIPKQKALYGEKYYDMQSIFNEKFSDIK